MFVKYFFKAVKAVGLLGVLFGACCMDSDPVSLPLTMIFAGAALLGIGILAESDYVEF